MTGIQEINRKQVESEVVEGDENEKKKVEDAEKVTQAMRRLAQRKAEVDRSLERGEVEKRLRQNMRLQVLAAKKVKLEVREAELVEVAAQEDSLLISNDGSFLSLDTTIVSVQEIEPVEMDRRQGPATQKTPEKKELWREPPSATPR